MKKLLLLFSLSFLITTSFTQTTVFSDDFTAGIGAWTATDFDGDGFNWGAFDLTGQGSSIDAQAGVAYSESYDVFVGTNGALLPDNFLASPALDLSPYAGQTIDFSFAVGTMYPTDVDAYFEENVSVYVVTDPTPANVILQAPIHSQVLTGGDQMFSFSYDISAFAGMNPVYLVFRHHNCTDEYFLVLDDVLVTATSLSVTADFVADVTSVCVNAPVTFSDLSIGVTPGFTTYDWDFGDGSAHDFTSGPVVHNYATAGMYTVTLTLDGGADTETKVNYIEVLDIPTVDNDPIVESQTVCAGSMTNPIDLVGTGGGGLDFSWTYTTNPAGENIGLPTSGTGDIPAFLAVNTTSPAVPIVATFTVTPFENGCNGTPIDITITVNPSDDPSFGYASSTYCEGSPNEPVAFVATPGGMFSSTTPGFVNPGSGMLDFTSLTAATYDVSYMTAGACPASSTIFIDVISAPVVNAIASYAVCEASPSGDILFTGTSASYDWTYTNAGAVNIGIPMAGSGDILSFTTMNGTGASVVSTFTVTPVSGSCSGTPMNFDLTVDPSIDPTFSYSAASYCATEANPTPTTTNAGGVFSSMPAGLVFADAIGTIDLAASAPGNYTVSYDFMGACPTNATFNVAIGNAPSVVNPGNFTYCENSATTDILFVGPAGTQFSWTNDNTLIGIGASGNGDILSFTTGINGSMQIANIQVTPFVGACIGTPENFTITVNPTEDATFIYAQTAFCPTDANPFPTITGVAGGTFSSIPAGLTLDPNTGEIDIPSSAQNTYDITYTSPSASCPGTFTFTVQIGTGSAVVNAVADITVCEGQVVPTEIFSGTAGATFDWTNDNTTIGLAASGTGDMPSFTAANGTGVTIVANISVTANDGTCPGTPETYTITVNPAEDPTFTLSAASQCTSDPTVPTTTLTGTPGGVFSVNPAGLTVDPNTGAIDIPSSVAGSYTITYTTPTCGTTMSQFFDLIQTPTVASLADIDECSGVVIPTIDISSLSTFPVDWTNDNTNTGLLSVSGTGDIASFLSNNPTAGGPTETSIITMTATNNGCVSAAVTFNINVLSLPTVSGGSDRTICEGSSITMNGVGSATSYTWDNGITNGVAFTPAAGSYIYTVTGTGANTCTASDQVSVLVNPAPVVSAGPDQVVCSGSQTVLNGSGAPTLNWNNGVTNNVPFVPNVSGDYIVVGVNATGCSARDTMVLTIEALPIPSFTSDINMGCIPTTVIFNSSATTNSCVYSFSDGTIENGCNNVTHTFNATGIYDVTLTQVSINGCIGSTTVPAMIVINPDPVAGIILDDPIVDMINSTTFFGNSSTGALTYEWNFGDNSALSFEDEVFHNFPTDAPGNYIVQLVATTQFGCKDTTFANVIVEESVIFYIANSFTPNGDELNNKFNPLMYAGFDPQDYNLKIYNRFGELIFESNDPAEGWDGDYIAGRGMAQAGTYTYKLVFNTPEKDEKKVISGHVNLIR